jgi:hypothetical protein
MSSYLRRGQGAPLSKRPAISRRDFIKAAATAAVTTAVGEESGLSLAQDMTKPVTLAFVGCAHIHTPSYVGLLSKRPDVKVKYVWDHGQARAARRAAKLNAKQTSDLGEIWSDRAVTAIVICSETDRHHDLVLAAARVSVMEAAYRGARSRAWVEPA